MPMIADCTALILAGGDSRRMGRDKATLVLDGATLLERVTATMQQIFPKVMVSVRQPRSGVDVPQVCDEQEAGGPLVGLIAGLAKADTPWVFAVACDMPFVKAGMVELLGSYRNKPQPSPALPYQGGSERSSPDLLPPDKGGMGGLGRPGGVAVDVCFDAVVPIIGGYPQPLAAFYATSALATMRASLAAGDKSLRGALKNLDVRYVKEDELRECDPQLRSFFDLDTPQDFATAQK